MNEHMIKSVAMLIAMIPVMCVVWIFFKSSRQLKQRRDENQRKLQEFQDLCSRALEEEHFRIHGQRVRVSVSTDPTGQVHYLKHPVVDAAET